MRVPPLQGGEGLWGWLTRAFSPGYNMTGLRPDWTGIDLTVDKVVRSGSRWAGEGNEVGKGGWEIGKKWNFYHLAAVLTRLFPQLSTQVIDFPHLAMVRLFREAGKRFFRPSLHTQKSLYII